MIKWAIAGIIAVVGLIGLTMTMTNLDANHLMVVQYPSGTLEAVTEPGPKMVWFGKVTTYDRRVEYKFGVKNHAPLRMRFNDGGHADLVGAVSFEMPLDKGMLVRIQKEFGGQEAVEQQLVARSLTNAIYFAGPLMSSTESAGERRNDLLQYVDDQARNGIYQTQTRPEKQKDPVTGQEKTVNVVEIIKNKDGTIARQGSSMIGAYGINLLQLSVSEIKYDAVVEAQIQERQKAITQVQIALANSKRAEQDALTAEKQGQANAATAKWAQETIKAQAVTEAEQYKEVAKLEKEAAQYTKDQQILLGQGEAERKRLVMAADGALEKKLATYEAVNANYATAIQNYQGNWVPSTVFGTNGASTNGAQALVDMLTAKTARDLNLDLRTK